MYKVFILSIFVISLQAQQICIGNVCSPPQYSGSVVPANCTVGATYNKTIAPVGIWICDSVNHWVQADATTVPVNTAIPTGLITFVISGICPAGWTQVDALNGFTLVGTTALSANVGTSGGSDTVIPSGTNSVPIFTGSALATHAHELPWQIPSTTTIRQIAVATFGQGTSRAATAVSAAGTGNTTSAAVALSQTVSAGTPAGTVTASTFTGTQFDNRSAFKRVIFCSKN